MAFLGSPPQSYWPTQFVAEAAFDPELTDPSLHDNQQTQAGAGPAGHHLTHGVPNAADATGAAHILDPALSDEIPSHQGQHPIIFHQTSPHTYAPPPPFATTATTADQTQPLPPPDQIFPGTGRVRAGSKDMTHPHNGEVMIDEHGGAYIAPQHPFIGNGMHSDVHQPLGQPAQIKFRATTNTTSGSGGGGRRPKMTKEEQMARRRLRTDTDEYRTQERERMRRRRAREKDEKDKLKREQEDQLRAQGKESWIAPASASGTPKRKTVKMVKKKVLSASSAGDDADDDALRESKRQAKVDGRATALEAGDDDEDMVEEEFTDIEIDDSTGSEGDDAEHGEDKEAGNGDSQLEGEWQGDEQDGSKEVRPATRRSAVGKPAPSVTPTRTTRGVAAKVTSTPVRSVRSSRSVGDQERPQEISTTRSGRTTRSALSTPAKEGERSQPPSIAIPTTAPAKMATRKQTVTTPASPSSPAISKTRVSLKTLTASTGGVPTTPGSVEGKSNGRSDKQSSQAPVVMLFGYPAGMNPPCDVSDVSVTVESTKNSKICMMTAHDMRAPSSPEEEKMDVDGEEKERSSKSKEEEEAEKERELQRALEKALEEDGSEKKDTESSTSAAAANQQRKSSTPENGANSRFSWDLVVQMLKADVGFDPEKDELVGFHHKDPLLLSCDRHINTAMVMAAKEGVRLPRWYVYEKQ